MLKLEQVISADDAVSRAMSVTTVYVGEALLQQEGLLLPVIHLFKKLTHMYPQVLHGKMGTKQP